MNYTKITIHRTRSITIRITSFGNIGDLLIWVTNNKGNEYCIRQASVTVLLVANDSNAKRRNIPMHKNDEVKVVE